MNVPLMEYASSTTYLLTRGQKKFSTCDPKEEWPHADLYDYNGKQIELFHMKWFNWQGLGWCLCEMPEVGASVQTFL